MQPRVLIIQHRTVVSDKVLELLKGRFDVVGITDTGETGIARALTLKPDVILVDVFLPDLNGFDAATQLKKEGCTAKILFLCTDERLDISRRTFELQVQGYVFTSQLLRDLITAIDVAMHNAVFLPSFVEKKEAKGAA